MEVFILLRDIFITLDACTPFLLARSGEEVKIVERFANGTMKVYKANHPDNECFFVGAEDVEQI